MTRHIHDRSNSADIACHFLETQCSGPVAHHIPATDYVRQDWDNGTLARIFDGGKEYQLARGDTPVDAFRTPRRLWPFLAPLAALLSLALAVAIWGRIG